MKIKQITFRKFKKHCNCRNDLRWRINGKKHCEHEYSDNEICSEKTCPVFKQLKNCYCKYAVNKKSSQQ